MNYGCMREKQHLANKKDLILAIAMSNAWICDSRLRGRISAKQPQAVKVCYQIFRRPLLTSSMMREFQDKKTLGKQMFQI